MVLSGLDYEIRYIGTRDGETETGQVAFLYPILTGPRLVGQSGWANHCPIESALSKNIFHLRRITDDIREEQAAEKVRWRDHRVLEQESSRLDYHAPNSRLKHSAGQRSSETL